MLVRERHNTRHDVVVVPASEVFVLEGNAVVQLGVENLGQLSIKHPVEIFTEGGLKRGRVMRVRIKIVAAKKRGWEVSFAAAQRVRVEDVQQNPSVPPKPFRTRI